MRSSVPIKDTWVSMPTKFNNMVAYLDWFDPTNSIEESVTKMTELSFFENQFFNHERYCS